MICGLLAVVILAQSQVRQATYLGRVDPQKGRLCAFAATDEKAYVSAIRKGGPDAEPDAPLEQDTGCFGYATQVKVLGPVDLVRWAGRALEPTPGVRVEILEGPLAGSKVVVASRNTFRGPARELAKADPYKPAAGVDPVPAYLSLRDCGGVMVAGSPDELRGADVLPAKISPKGARLVDGMMMLAETPHGTYSKLLGLIGEAGDAKRPVAAVEIRQGVGKGRTVYVELDAIHVLEPSKPVDYQAEIRKTAAKARARRSARVRAGKAREADAQAKQDQALADYQAALPSIVEMQQRQVEMITAVQRAAAMQRMATAQERAARAAEFRAGVPQIGVTPPAFKVQNPFANQD